MRSTLDRREFLATAAVAGAAGAASLGGWLGRLAAAAPVDGQRGPSRASCFGWPAGPSHIDTFDPKPEAPADVRGEFRAIETSVPGIRISEHFPTLRETHAARRHPARHEHPGVGPQAGDVPPAHRLPKPRRGRGVPEPRRDRRQGAGQAGRGAAELHHDRPRAAGGAARAGFLGPDQQPLAVNDPVRGLDFIEPAGAPGQFGRQIDLLHGFDEAFHARYASAAGETHRSLDRPGGAADELAAEAGVRPFARAGPSPRARTARRPPPAHARPAAAR